MQIYQWETPQETHDRLKEENPEEFKLMDELLEELKVKGKDKLDKPKSP